MGVDHAGKSADSSTPASADRMAYVGRYIPFRRIFETVNTLLQDFEAAGHCADKMDPTQVLTTPLDILVPFLLDTMQGAPTLSGLKRCLTEAEGAALVAWVQTLQVSEIWEREELDPNAFIQVKIEADGLGVAGIQMANVTARVADVMSPTRIIS